MELSRCSGSLFSSITTNAEMKPARLRSKKAKWRCVPIDFWRGVDVG